MSQAQRMHWFEAESLLICDAFKRFEDIELPQNWNKITFFISHLDSLDVFAARYHISEETVIAANTMIASFLGHRGL